MKPALKSSAKTSAYEGLSADALLAEKDARIAAHDRNLQECDRAFEDRDHLIRKRGRSSRERDTRIKLLEVQPFAVCRMAWFFADTTRGTHASATMYSLIDTAKACDLEPRAYLLHAMQRIGDADTLVQLEALLPGNTGLPNFEKNGAGVSSG